jgi:hypothetical protein
MLGDVWSDVGNLRLQELVDTDPTKPWWFPHGRWDES